MKTIFKTLAIFIPIFLLVFLMSTIILQKYADAQGSVLTEEYVADNLAAQRLTLELQKINSLQNRISSDIFNNPIFKSLQDFSKPLPVEERGRSNPFAPLGL
jgi:regulatory protein YycI of two-component signal transduction system YycFG